MFPPLEEDLVPEERLPDLLDPTLFLELLCELLRLIPLLELDRFEDLLILLEDLLWLELLFIVLFLVEGDCLLTEVPLLPFLVELEVPLLAEDEFLSTDLLVPTLFLLDALLPDPSKILLLLVLVISLLDSFEELISFLDEVLGLFLSYATTSFFLGLVPKALVLKDPDLLEP